MAAALVVMIYVLLFTVIRPTGSRVQNREPLKNLVQQCSLLVAVWRENWNELFNLSKFRRLCVCNFVKTSFHSVHMVFLCHFVPVVLIRCLVIQNERA